MQGQAGFILDADMGDDASDSTSREFCKKFRVQPSADAAVTVLWLYDNQQHMRGVASPAGPALREGQIWSAACLCPVALRAKSAPEKAKTGHWKTEEQLQSIAVQIQN